MTDYRTGWRDRFDYDVSVRHNHGDLQRSTAMQKEHKGRGVKKSAKSSPVFRKIISEHLNRTSSLSAKDWANDPFFRIGKRPGHSGHANISEEHSRCLY